METRPQFINRIDQRKATVISSELLDETYHILYKCKINSDNDTPPSTVMIESNDTDWILHSAAGLAPQPDKLEYHKPGQILPKPFGMDIEVEQYKRLLKESRFLRHFSKYTTETTLGSKSAFLSSCKQDARNDLQKHQDRNYNYGINWKGIAATAISLFHIFRFKRYDETSHEGNAQVTLETYEDCGYLDRKDGHFECVKHGKIFKHGDQKTIKGHEAFKEAVLKKSVEDDNPANLNVLQKLFDMTAVLCGDFHTCMCLLLVKQRYFLIR